MTNTIKRLRTLSSFVALSGALAISAATGSASAAVVNATGGPTQVEYPGFLMIQFAGVNYQATQTLVTGCSQGNIGGQSIDTIKFWHSIAQSALLAGKTLTIYFSDCTIGGVTTHYIGDVVLVK